MSRIAAVLLLLSLAACGARGALVLPPGPVPEPLLGYPKAPAKPVATRPDVSTDDQPHSAQSQ